MEELILCTAYDSLPKRDTKAVTAQSVLGTDVHYLAQEEKAISVSGREFESDLVPRAVPLLRQDKCASDRQIADTAFTPSLQHSKHPTLAHPLSREGALGDFVPGVPAIRSIHPVFP